MSKSEFGRGLTYNLGLFLAHEGQAREFRKTYEGVYKKSEADRWASLWFNASSDHLYELQNPETLPAKIRQRLDKFRKKCLHWGQGFTPPEAKPKDVLWALQEARNLLRAIDKHHGVETKKGDWE